MLCLRRGDTWDAPTGLTFGAWADGQLPGNRPTYDDLDYHLSTLFPPVRPRGYLEVRYLDAQPGDGWIAPTLLLTALMSAPYRPGAGRGRACCRPLVPGGARGAERQALVLRAARDVVDLGTEVTGPDRCGSRTHRCRRNPAAAHRRRHPRKASFMNHQLSDLSPEGLRSFVAEQLERSRARTVQLTDAVDTDDLVRQHSKLMSPLVWDYAHIGNQEELWLVRDVGGREPLRQDIDELYDAFMHARADRPSLPLLGPAETRSVRRRGTRQGAGRAGPREVRRRA